MENTTEEISTDNSAVPTAELDTIKSTTANSFVPMNKLNKTFVPTNKKGSPINFASLLYINSPEFEGFYNPLASRLAPSNANIPNLETETFCYAFICIDNSILYCIKDSKTPPFAK